MYSTHSESKSVVAEKFIRNLKAEFYKKITVINKKSNLGYLNKLVDEHKNTYYYSIGKNPIDTDYSALSEKVETNLKSPKFKFGDTVRITKYKNFSSKSYTENWSREIFVIDSVLKTNLWTYKKLTI